MKNEIIAIQNTGSRTFIRLISLEVEGRYEFGVRYGRGRGRLFNLYTRYYLKDLDTGQHFWEGNLINAPNMMNPSERRSVYDFVSQTPRIRKWLGKKIREFRQAVIKMQYAEGVPA